MVPRARPLPLLPPPSAARDRLCAGALQAALRRHAQGARRALSALSQGCPGGIIADEPEEHSLVAEFGMYYKSPEIAPLAQPANPLEATTGEATTGAGAPTGGAPAGTAMPMEDLAGAVDRGAAGAAAIGAARAGTASAAPVLEPSLFMITMSNSTHPLAACIVEYESS